MNTQMHLQFFNTKTTIFPTTLYWHAKVKIGGTYQESKDRDNLNVVFDLFGGENEHACSIYPHTPTLLFLNSTQW
jgi:hypothetical protein